jgi:hypothetical protein
MPGYLIYHFYHSINTVRIYEIQNVKIQTQQI